MANILIDVGHPAHVHLFRNAARDWQLQGHQVLFTALDREMIVYLLDAYELPYRITYKRRKGKLALILELFLRTIITYRIARHFQTDLFVSIGNPTVGLPAYLMRKPYLALTDTEHAVEQHALFKPFATLIATPNVFNCDLGPKHIRYRGYHELAYLHPDEFKPDIAVLESLGLTPSDPFFVIRFVAWGATHDIGQRGFTLAEKKELLQELSRYGRILLSVEGDIDPEFAPFVTHFPLEQIHHLLAFAAMYIGEGGTMLTEAAILGTPALFVSTLRAGNWDDLGNYELLYCFNSGREAIDKIKELIKLHNLREIWAERRSRLLADKINPTPWLVQLVNNLLKNASYKPIDE